MKQVEPVGGTDFLEAAHKWQERAENAERELGEALTDREQLNNDVDGLHRVIKEDREALAKAEREVAGLRADAERYRWLREAQFPMHGQWAQDSTLRVTEQINIKLGSDCPTGERLDAAIDAAHQEELKEGK